MIGAETFSRILDWEDRGTCVLFGDGAGAVVLKAVAGRRSRRPRHAVDASALRRPPVRHPLCRRRPVVDAARRAFCAWRARGVPPRGASICRGRRRGARRPTGSTAADIDWLVPHQANSRIIDAIGRSLGLPASRSSSPIDAPRQHLGGLDSAGADEAVGDGRIEPGHLVLMEAIGGGLSWGASLVRW